MFLNRIDAGKRLAPHLEHLRGHHPVVVGLPRGGVPVASEVAKALGAPLDVIIVRKLGVPSNPEVALGAIGEDGARVINREVMELARVSASDLAAIEKRERTEVERRAIRFRGKRPPQSFVGRTVIIIDDGLATGSTAKVACLVARARGAARVVLAVPVAPANWSEEMIDDADELICVETPDGFHGVGQWYADFSQTTDDEVQECLQRAWTHEHSVGVDQGEPMYACDEDDVEISIESTVLRGHLVIPEHPRGIVMFAHGSGSSRHSPRNRFVAGILHSAQLGTLLIDLLSVEEQDVRSNVFDVELLGDRLIEVTRWLRRRPEAAGIPLGYFGASTGAAAAFWAAGDAYNNVDAIVTRGGRPDLTGPRLAAVTAPTLLVVGENDKVALRHNAEAQQHLHCKNELAIVPQATHLFEEDGALLEVAELARDWFLEHLSAPSNAGSTDRDERANAPIQ
jgi:putative phosphoribosyl transferase